MKKVRKIAAFFMIMILSATILTSCGADGTEQGKTRIEVFAFKPEAVDIFKELGAKFEKENPDIEVYVNTPGDAYTLLKARMVKGDVPDIVGLDAGQYYVDYAKADIFADLTDTAVMQKVKPSYKEMLTQLEETDGTVHALPYAANATGIIYNKDIFEELNLTVPKTWSELEQICEKIKEAGKTPFYLGYKEDWTINSAWNPLAGNFSEPDFYQKVTEGTANFEQTYEEPLNRLIKLNDFSQGDIFSYNYNNATVGFANGESVMYMQGNWAIPVILQTNPNINIDMFPFPAMDNPEDNKLCSSIDLLFSITKKSKHFEESLRFLEFLTAQENIDLYLKSQYGIPAINCEFDYPKQVQGIVKDFESENIVSSPQAFYPTEMSLPIALQTYMLDNNKNKLFEHMNTVWKDVYED